MLVKACMTDPVWRFGGSNFSSMPGELPTWSRYEYMDISLFKVPALAENYEIMLDMGFSYSKESSVSVCRHTKEVGRDDEKVTTVTYSMGFNLIFNKDHAAIVYNVKGHGNSVDEAINSAYVALDRCSVRYNAEPLEMGKGQIIKAKEIARSLFRDFPDYLPEGHEVRVPVHTRGGKYGWKAKIAHREFSKESLDDKKKESTPSIMCQVEEFKRQYVDAEKSWGGSMRTKLTMIEDQLVRFKRFCRMKYLRCDDSYAYFSEQTSFTDDYAETHRIALKDWDRLKTKYVGTGNNGTL